MAEERAQRRLAAILAADVVGYSRLMEQDEAGTLSALKERRKGILQPLVSEYRGRLVKVTGDGVIVEFASAVNSVACAVELQKRMALANASLPDDRHIILRIGINLGDVMVEGNDLYGDGVNIAARLEGIAEPGGIMISGTAYDYVKNKIDVGLTDLGTQTLKNIVEPVRVYQVTGTPYVRIPTAKAATERPSLAVLPFVNMSGDPEQQYFSDGVTEDIITELSRFHEIFVIARNSSFQYRDKAVDVRRVARELGVRYVVEGSLRRTGGHLRITAQLIEATTGNHVWSERYDRRLADVFVIQDQVVQAIVARIAGQLAISEFDKARRKRTGNLGAYDCFLRGLDHWRETGADEGAESSRWLEKALELDPDYAEPLPRLSINAAIEAVVASDSANQLDRAMAMANRAVTLDPNNAWAHCALGFAKLASGSVPASRPHFETALRLNPNDPDLMMWCVNHFIYSGEFDTAESIIKTCERLNPLPPAWYGAVKGIAEYNLHRYASAAQLIEALRDKEWWLHCYLAASYQRLGKTLEARRAVEVALKARPTLTVRELAALETYVRADDLQHLLEPARAAGLPE
jgi:TolB-like protein/tetratricopeptide (TPR) repeat protein